MTFQKRRISGRYCSSELNSRKASVRMWRESIPLVEEVDGLALAGAVDAVDQDHHRLPGLRQQRILGIQQGGAQFRFAPLVFLLADAVTDLGGFKHGVFSGSLCAAIKRSDRRTHL
jgi:hypothetical protein